MPEEAIKRYGKSTQALTDHGSQFYANEKGNARRGAAAFEAKLVELGIRHVMVRLRPVPYVQGEPASGADLSLVV